MSPHPPTGARTVLLEVVPLGAVDELALDIIAAHVQSLLGLTAEIVPRRCEPDDAYLPSRRQYDAVKIIRFLFASPRGRPFTLAVTGSDLCTPILTYVYGESQLGGKVAVVSLHRLAHAQRPRGYERAAKISLHEIGHLMGVDHCRSRGCLMYFSKQLDQLDDLSLRFCPACDFEITRRIANERRTAIQSPLL